LNEQPESVPVNKVGKAIILLPHPDPFLRFYHPPVEPCANDLQAGLPDEPQITLPVLRTRVGGAMVLGTEKHTGLRSFILSVPKTSFPLLKMHD
jgi:hypothetical protein